MTATVEFALLMAKLHVVRRNVLEISLRESAHGFESHPLRHAKARLLAMQSSRAFLSVARAKRYTCSSLSGVMSCKQAQLASRIMFFSSQ